MNTPNKLTVFRAVMVPFFVAAPMDMNTGKLWEMVRDREAWHAAGHGVVKSRTRLDD